MAQKTVCDKCGEDISPTDLLPYDWNKFQISVSAAFVNAAGIVENHADLCPACLHGAAKAHDRSPQEAPRPYGPFKWLVTLKGVKTLGPHAGFLFEEDARRFATTYPGDGGGEVKPA